jgi:diacylglycerol kinase
MRIHLLAAAVAIGMGFIVHLSRVEWGLISVTIFMVLAAETINTAIERTVDLISTERHPLAKLAKDLAAGGVLLTAVNAIVIAILLFGPFLISLIK